MSSTRLIQVNSAIREYIPSLVGDFFEVAGVPVECGPLANALALCSSLNTPRDGTGGGMIVFNITLDLS